MTPNGGMDRNDLAIIAALSDEQLSLMTCVTLASVVTKNAEVDVAHASVTAAVAAQKATDDATLAAAQAQAATDQAAAVAAAIAPLNASIGSLTAQVGGLTAQLAGSAGSYQVTLTTTQLAALTVLAAQQGTSVAAELNALAYAALNQAALGLQGPLFAAAIARLPDVSPENRQTIFDKLGITADAAERLGLQAFLSISAADQNTVMGLLGLES